MEFKENVIIKVEPESIGEELGLEPGDILLAVNDQPVRDVFDYRYLIHDEYLELKILTAQGEECIAQVEKDYDEDLGIVFESGLMDEAKSCKNKCIFCFIDQLPKGMRQSLYFKDDDSRLSFLQGNYVTLTNMSDEDISHILFYHLSPINISVHTTDMQLRREMLKNPNAFHLLRRMKQLAEGGIAMNLQVVLCKGVNDGDKLDQTIKDCAAFFPHAKSMSVVPIGLTKHREELPPLKPFGREDCLAVLKQVESWQKKLKKELGTAFVFASDEFYLKAGQGMPSVEAYEDFTQYENGVGMLSLLEWEFMDALSKWKSFPDVAYTLSIATGEAAAGLLQTLANRVMERCPLRIEVYPIHNEFFGPEITVSGLLTGQDIIKQLQGKELGNCLLLPDSLLRNDTTTLLDDIEVWQIEKALQTPIRITKNSGEALLKNMLSLEEQTP